MTFCYIFDAISWIESSVLIVLALYNPAFFIPAKTLSLFYIIDWFLTEILSAWIWFPSIEELAMNLWDFIELRASICPLPLAICWTLVKGCISDPLSFWFWNLPLYVLYSESLPKSNSTRFPPIPVIVPVLFERFSSYKIYYWINSSCYFYYSRI